MGHGIVLVGTRLVVVTACNEGRHCEKTILYYYLSYLLAFAVGYRETSEWAGLRVPTNRKQTTSGRDKRGRGGALSIRVVYQ